MAQEPPLIVVSSGEPAGIGPDICIALADAARSERIAVLGDPQLLRSRARQLNREIRIREISNGAAATPQATGELQVIAHRLRADVQAGITDSRNAAYVIDMLSDGGRGCLEGRYSAFVTAPVHKSVICAAGYPFTGHTEFLATLCGVDQPVMLLVRDALRVALVTTHLPLREVPDAITFGRIRSVADVLNRELRNRFDIEQPRILVLGLNPHAGEDATLGTEERDIIEPCLAHLRRDGIDVVGPRPADTAFTQQSLDGVDAVLAMYHDQGLTPIKAAGFGRIVNVTLGLPFVRTSVDHGTALSLAGTGAADPESLHCAVELAAHLTARQTSG
jgi:4-hydroxythreonine-4-phosphate dehydrogenase